MVCCGNPFVLQTNSFSRKQQHLSTQEIRFKSATSATDYQIHGAGIEMVWSRRVQSSTKLQIAGWIGERWERQIQWYPKVWPGLQFLQHWPGRNGSYIHKLECISNPTPSCAFPQCNNSCIPCYHWFCSFLCFIHCSFLHSISLCVVMT